MNDSTNESWLIWSVCLCVFMHTLTPVLVNMVGFKPSDAPPPLGVKMASAGAAACIADIVTFPLDTAKVRLQVSVQWFWQTKCPVSHNMFSSCLPQWYYWYLIDITSEHSVMLTNIDWADWLSTLSTSITHKSMSLLLLSAAQFSQKGFPHSVV